MPISYYDSYFIKDAGKAIVTPITIALDTIHIIGKILVYPLNK